MKYLEVPDFHYAKAWADISISCGNAVAKTATDNKVDFIALPADFFDSPIFANDKGGMEIAQGIMERWTAICPVVGIEGTPAHDAPGCYGIFKNMNFTLLKPGKVYGYFSKDFAHESFITDMKKYPVHTPECILFGIPELNKSSIQAQLSLPAEQANAEAVNLFGQYIDEFVGPMRLKYKDIPAVGLLHGAVSDSRQENSTDVILKASDIVIHTEILERANLDRWSLGHFHSPWESEKICGGYAGYPGIDSNPWGKRDFIPGFNFVTIHSDIHTEITRIPYGTSERRKILITDKDIPVIMDIDVAYWIESEDPEAVLPTNLHPWSRITYIEQQTETRRVTKEEAEKAVTLWDMFKLIDPDVKPELKEKVDSIPEYKKDKTGNRLDARLGKVIVKGCDLFGGKTVEWNLDELAVGLNQLTGTNGNGDGKSSLLGVCTWFPGIVGKDTKSGRQSALKDFFSGQDSSIEKFGPVNGKEHHHLITIKGAHTQTPKVECYLYIDGVSQLEKATFDTMFEKCEDLYGNYEDYLLTTFYEQPQQSKNQRSGLMTATMTEARNLVQNIAGIDREKEKRFALDQVADCEKTEQQLTSDINALEKYSEDIDLLKKEIKEKSGNLVIGNDALKIKEESVIMTKQQVESLQLKKTENEKAKDRRTSKTGQISDISNSIDDAKTEIYSLKTSVASLELNQDSIKEDDENKKLELEYSKLLTEYNRIMNEYNNSIIEQTTIKTEQQNIIDNAETTKQSHNKEIELISEPCPECGYIDPKITQKIDNLNNSITLLDESIKMSFDNIKKLIDIPKPKIIEPVKPIEPVLSESERSSIQESITTGLKAETAIEGLEAAIKKDNVLIQSYNKELIEIIIDTEIDSILLTAEDELSNIRKQYTDTKSNISTLVAEKKSIEDRLKKAKEGAQELKEKKGKLLTSEVNKNGWNYIQKMLNPDKIPALELDIVATKIDEDATKNIEPFLEGRYSYHTETQKPGKNSTVDKFDVMIHDAETGQSFSMFYTNPGNKAFYSDCYIKALIRKRNERQMRSYSPIIYDEADGPVNPKRVKQYYDIQQAYFKDEKVIIVSQKDISASYVEKVFNIEEMKS